MVLPQRVTAEESFQLVPPVLAAAAAAYRRALIAESAQLALMGQQSLNEDWTDDVRATVLLARQRIVETEQARVQLRDRVREFVVTLRDAGESASAVVRHTRSMIRVLESNGAGDAGRRSTGCRAARVGHGGLRSALTSLREGGQRRLRERLQIRRATPRSIRARAARPTGRLRGCSSRAAPGRADPRLRSTSVAARPSRSGRCTRRRRI